MTGERVDIDARFQPLTIGWKGRDWEVAPGVPVSALTMASGLDDFTPSNPEHAIILVAGLLRVTVDEVRDLDPTREELYAILWEVAKFYGMPLGESSASSTESGKPAGRSRPTSSASTA